MFVHYKTKGFIFGKKDFRESDRIFLIFTQDFGNLEILAKGERKITSKLRTGLELFYLSEIEFIQGKTYKTLTDALGREKFKNIRMNLEKLEIAFRISEILKNFLKFQEPDKKLWHLIISTFKELNNWSLAISHWDLSIIYYYFLWNFLSILGYQPELNNCVLCNSVGGSLQQSYFSSKEGGIICQNCFKRMDLKEREYISKINLKVLKILKTFLPPPPMDRRGKLRENIDILRKIKISREEKRNLETLSDNFLSFLPRYNII